MTRCRARRCAALVIVIAVGAMAALADGRIRGTSAAWVDTEYDHGVFVTLDCSELGLYTTNARGRFLSGTGLGIDLDQVAAAAGLHVANDGTSSTPTPATATSLGDDAYLSVLDVALLAAEEPQFSQAFPLPVEGAPFGAYNQFAQARSNGRSTGAAGAVTNTGAVRVGEGEPEPGLPPTGNVNMEDLQPAVTPFSDARVEIGAVAASATVDACRDPDTVTREYGIASLRLGQSTLIADLVDTIETAVAAADTTIENLETGLVDNVTSLLESLGLVTVEVDGDVDLQAALAPLLDDVRSDPEGIVTIDLANGTITMDLDALLKAQTGLGINGRDPNTELLDGTFFALAAPYAVTIVNGLLDDLETDLLAAVTDALANSQLRLEAYVPPILLTPRVDLLTIDGPLLDDPDVTGDELTITVLSGLVGNGVTVRTSVQTELNSVVGGTLSTLNTAIVSAAGIVGTGVDDLLDALQVLSMMVNVQPDQPNAPSAPVPPAGAYEVGALRIAVLDELAPPTYVSYARASAGPNTPLP